MMFDFSLPHFYTLFAQEWTQFVRLLFARQEFLSRLIQREFLSVHSLAEMVLALGLMAGLAYIVARWQKRPMLGEQAETPKFHVYWLRRLAFPFVLLLASIAAAFLWHELTGQRTVWFRLLVIAAPWMMVIRTVTAILHYILPDNKFSDGTERFFSGVIWIAFVLWLSGIDDMLSAWAKAQVLTLGKSQFSLYTIANGVFWVLVVLVFAMWLARLIESRLMALERMDLSLRIVLGKIIKTLFVVLAILITLPMLGIDLTVLSVFGGALGVGLGFGLQKVASNYVSGFIILLDHSIRIGDRLVLKDFTGYVTRITSRYVVIKGVGGSEALVPNETFIAEMVVNESFTSKKLWRSLSVQVAYATDLPVALEIMRAAAADQERVDQVQPPNAYLKAFADSGIDLTVGFWVKDPENGFLALDSAILLTIWQKFKESGIEFPFPQREIRILNDDLSAKALPGRADDEAV